jgi:hypothetical protein
MYHRRLVHVGSVIGTHRKEASVVAANDHSRAGRAAREQYDVLYLGDPSRGSSRYRGPIGYVFVIQQERQSILPRSPIKRFVLAHR